MLADHGHTLAPPMHSLLRTTNTAAAQLRLIEAQRAPTYLVLRDEAAHVVGVLVDELLRVVRAGKKEDRAVPRHHEAPAWGERGRMEGERGQTGEGRTRLCFTERG